MLVALGLLIATVVVAMANVPKPGSGRIYFGHVQYQHHLQGQSKVVSTSVPGFAFVAHLKQAPGSTEASGVFQKWTGHRWRPVWRVSALIPGAADTILAKNYKLRFLARHGISPPGFYRMIIFGHRGKWLAHGRFWMNR